MGLTPKHFLRVAREHTYALHNPDSPHKDSQDPPDWMAAKIRLGIMPSLHKGLVVKEEQPMTVPGAKKSGEGKPLRELEIVE